MDTPQLALYSVLRVLHVGTAIVLVGGTFFMRFVVMRAAIRVLSEDDHARLRAACMAVWKKVVHSGIALLLISGGWNYYRVISEGAHKGDGLYHGLLGTKILLALGIFFIASALVGRSPAFDAMRNNARKWLAVNLLLALLIVAISGFLKIRGPKSAGPGAIRPGVVRFGSSSRMNLTIIPASTVGRWTARSADARILIRDSSAEWLEPVCSACSTGA